jgi:hypothetical protein
VTGLIKAWRSDKNTPAPRSSSSKTATSMVTPVHA